MHASRAMLQQDVSPRVPHLPPQPTPHLKRWFKRWLARSALRRLVLLGIIVVYVSPVVSAIGVHSRPGALCRASLRGGSRLVCKPPARIRARPCTTDPRRTHWARSKSVCRDTFPTAGSDRTAIGHFARRLQVSTLCAAHRPAIWATAVVRLNAPSQPQSASSWILACCTSGGIGSRRSSGFSALVPTHHASENTTYVRIAADPGLGIIACKALNGRRARSSWTRVMASFAHWFCCKLLALSQRSAFYVCTVP